MSSEKKALFLDLDGTLLNDKKEITPGNYHAIRQALGEGHKIIIATGRPLASAIKQAERLGLTEKGCYVISFNGGVIFDMGNQEVITSHAIPLAVVAEIFREANKRNIHIQTYTADHVVVEARCDDDQVRTYCNRSNINYEVLPDISHLYDAPPKMLTIDYESGEALTEFRDWINEHCSEELDSFFSATCYLEIVPKGINKGRALLDLSAALGIPVEATIAAGDEANDIPMIKTAGLGVCMENGIPEAKAVADYITLADNNQNGIAEVINTFMLN